jgi:hypothetical protein
VLANRNPLPHELTARQTRRDLFDTCTELVAHTTTTTMMIMVIVRRHKGALTKGGG